MINTDTKIGDKVRYIGYETIQWNHGDEFTLERFEIKRHGWSIKLLNVPGMYSPEDFENMENDDG